MIWIGLIVVLVFFYFIRKNNREKKKIKDLSNKETSNQHLGRETEQLTEQEIQQFIEDEVSEMVFQETLDYSSGFEKLISDAILLFVDAGLASTSLLQRKLNINYNQADALVDKLEELDFIGPFRGSKAREVLYQNIPISYIEHIQRKKENSPKRLLFKKQLLSKYTEEINKKVSKRLREYNEERIKQEIKDDILNKEASKNMKLQKDKLRKEVVKELAEEGLINEEEYISRKREPIPQEVQDKVWNRDGGACVKCGSKENLEFDHIIPFSKGGSNTYRNLQLLCQKCNREKSNKIG